MEIRQGSRPLSCFEVVRLVISVVAYWTFRSGQWSAQLLVIPFDSSFVADCLSDCALVKLSGSAYKQRPVRIMSIHGG